MKDHCAVAWAGVKLALMWNNHVRGLVLILLTPLFSLFALQIQAAEIAVTILDQSTSQPVPCRVHLKDGAGQPVRPAKLPFWRDHFVCPGAVQLQLAPGQYAYEIERGPEYWVRTGSFTVSDSTNQSFTVKLERLADMAAEGWWSGELHVHRPVQDIELLMQAEDLHVAPVITWWNNQNLWAKQKPPADLLVRFDQDRFYHLMGGEDEREGGALLYYNLPEPLRIAGASREYPSPMKFLSEARRHQGVWLDIEKPFWWDVPIWLAGGQIDSIGLANNHQCRDQMYETEAWGKPRDVQRLPPPRGNGYWSQEIYYHILNCGLRVPPSAGSASGVLPNPVGYNRVYVYLGSDFSYEQWWEGLRAGRSFVSNGPLLRCKANGEWPGHVFTASEGQELTIQLQAAVATRDAIASLEIIKNGQIARAVPFEEWRKSGSLGALHFKESGWFLVRAITDNPKTFRFASTAPYYVEIGKTKSRVSKTSAMFFLDWVRERSKRVKLDDATQREEVLKYHTMAEKFWLEKVAQANAD